MSGSKYTLMKHQLEAVERAKNNLAIFHEPGLGKTLTALEIFKRTKHMKLLVVCPIDLIESSWRDDIEKFTNFKMANLRKIKDNLEDYDIHCINYEMIAKIKLNFNYMCILDESSKIKSHKAKRTKFLLKINHIFEKRYVLTGTPYPNCPSEVWSQLSFIGYKESFFKFCQNHLYYKRGDTIYPFHGMEMKKQGFRLVPHASFYDVVNKYAHIAKAKDCLDLPDKMFLYRKIDLNREESESYMDIKENYVFKDTVVPEILSRMNKMRQCTSGFVIKGRQDENGKWQTKPFEFKKKSKLASLAELIEEISSLGAIIIWANYRHEFEMIKEKLYKEDLRTLYGGTKNKDQVIRDFKDEKFKILVAHPQSCGFGHTFTHCKVMVFFSLSYSYEDYKQCQDRIMRKGQTNKCRYIHLIANNTIDEDILKALKRKESFCGK